METIKSSVKCYEIGWNFIHVNVVIVRKNEFAAMTNIQRRKKSIF